MRKPIILFTGITILIIFVILACLIFKTFVPTVFDNENYQTFYLNTDEMQQADTAIINSNNGNYAHAAYNFRGSSKKKTLGANAFLIVYPTDSLNLNADTILVLDTGAYKKPELNINEYYVYITPRKAMTGCLISAPQKPLPFIKSYKFIYAKVDLVTED